MSDTFDIEASRKLTPRRYEPVSWADFCEVQDALAAACDEAERVKVERDAAIRTLGYIDQAAKMAIGDASDSLVAVDKIADSTHAALRQARGEERGE